MQIAGRQKGDGVSVAFLSCWQRYCLLLPCRRHIRATSMRHFGRHAHRFAQRRVRVDGLADVDRVGTHLDGQADFADHVAGRGADDGTADDAVRLQARINLRLLSGRRWPLNLNLAMLCNAITQV